MFRQIVILLVVLSVAACGDKPVAYDYCATPVEGWEPGDTLRFRIDTIRRSGDYELSLGVRTSASTPYPFQSLWLVVRQHWHNPERLVLDTLECRLTDEKGDVAGRGISLYQYDLPWKRVRLEAGDCADFSVYHIMRRELLPGITDVGVKVSGL